MSRARIDVLRSLVAYEQPLEILRSELGAFEWDTPVVLHTVRREDLARMLERFLAGTVDAGQLEEWANLIECRDDLGFPENDPVPGNIVFRLANPYLEGAINLEHVRKLREEL